jgi:hypothetical protein
MLGFAKLNPTYQNMGLSAVLVVSQDLFLAIFSWRSFFSDLFLAIFSWRSFFSNLFLAIFF